LRENVRLTITKLGRILKNGEFVESPFDEPVEERRYGDPDQTEDDRKFAAGDECSSLEPELAGGKKKVSEADSRSLCKFFLDGSLRTKYLGDYIQEPYSFPVLASETASAVVERDGASCRPAKVLHRLSFVFPHKDSGLIDDTTYERLVELSKELVESAQSLRIEFLGKVATDVRYSMLGKARAVMHKIEHELASSLSLNEDRWLVMDGSIRKEEFEELPFTIGLAKSFSRKPLFNLGNGRRLMITSYLSKVRTGERSAVYRPPGKESSLVFWYIRLRTYPPMEPLGGLVKVEFSLRGREFEDQREFVDALSAEIYSMRSPSVYPYPRWPSFVYPIRLAELVMGNLFMNPEELGLYGNYLRRTILEARDERKG